MTYKQNIYILIKTIKLTKAMRFHHWYMTFTSSNAFSLIKTMRFLYRIDKHFLYRIDKHFLYRIDKHFLYRIDKHYILYRIDKHYILYRIDKHFLYRI